VLPRDRVDVRLSMCDDDDRRRVEVTVSGASWAERRAALEAALARVGGG
jgi:hypothetical protein